MRRGETRTQEGMNGKGGEEERRGGSALDGSDDHDFGVKMERRGKKREEGGRLGGGEKGCGRQKGRRRAVGLNGSLSEV